MIKTAFVGGVLDALAASGLLKVSADGFFSPSVEELLKIAEEVLPDNPGPDTAQEVMQAALQAQEVDDANGVGVAPDQAAGVDAAARSVAPSQVERQAQVRPPRLDDVPQTMGPVETEIGISGPTAGLDEG